MKNKSKNILIGLAFLGSAAGMYACSKSFLNNPPLGVLDQNALSSAKGVDRLIISAYAMLDSYDGGLNIGGQWGSGASNFVFGSMAGGEANRGSTPGDQAANITPAILRRPSPTNQAYNDRWTALYEGVKRCNIGLEVLNSLTVIDSATKHNDAGQLRFLRAWYHFQARITFGNVPYINEDIDQQLSSGAVQSVANDHDIFPEIAADAQYAYQNLPEQQDAKGRINKWTASALYGKILIFQKDFANAKTVLNDVVTNGKTPLLVPYDLNANYYDNFNIATENSKESVFAFQSSSNDGGNARNANWGDNLNQPAALSGAGFFDPTYFFVNQFKTDANGLPAANPQNKEVLDPVGTDPKNNGAAGYTQYSGNVDTRLDWTIGRNGVPFLDWGNAQTSWQRDATCGPFYCKKVIIQQAQTSAYHDAAVWFSAGGTALNVNFIRFSDVLLLLAEADVETNDLAGAFALVNRVRTRAQNTETVVFPTSLGTPVTRPYTTPFASQDAARSAVHLERLLELGMEGQRFFDLVRWGVAESELNTFYAYETSIPYSKGGDLDPKPTYPGASGEYVSIPQQQIDLSYGFLKQN